MVRQVKMGLGDGLVTSGTAVYHCLSGLRWSRCDLKTVRFSFSVVVAHL